MDVSSKDLSRAKYRLSQSRKRAQKKGGRAGGPTQQRQDTAQQRPDSAAPKARLNVEEDGPSLATAHDDVPVHSDRIDLQSLLDTAWTAQSTSSHHRHAAMIESLLQQSKTDLHPIQDDVAELDFALLGKRLQQCPEYLISGVHPSVTSEAAQTAVLARRMNLQGDSARMMPTYAAPAQTASDQVVTNSGPGQSHASSTSRHAAAQRTSTTSPSESATRLQQPTAQDVHSHPGSTAAPARRNQAVASNVEDDMEDDLDLLLACSSKLGNRQLKGSGANSQSSPAHQSSAAVQALTPHQSRRPSSQSHATKPIPRPAAAPGPNKADLEDWLDI